MLALPWREFDPSEEAGGLRINNRTLRVVQQANNPDGSGLAVWDCAFVLAKYLETQAPGLVEGKSVLELGAGTGVVGLAAYFLGAKQVCLTDLEYALDNLRSNVAANCAQDGVFCQELDWAKPQDYRQVLRGMRPEVVLMSDIVWLAEQAPVLVGQLVAICQQFAPETLLLAHQTRSRRTDEVLFGLLSEGGFAISPALHHRHHHHSHIQLFRLIYRC